jgi:sulfur-carrier protein adenylyltransferase/sulfurtransferase
MEFRTYKLRADPGCPVCGKNRTITEPIDYEQFCGQPILDANSQAETAAEVKKAMNDAAGGAKVELDDRGLPKDYPWQADWEVTPREVKAMLDKKEDFVFIDCRLPHEYAITKIEGAKLIPLQQLNAHLAELRMVDDQKIIVHCRSGGRSLQFAEILRRQGFDDVRSMAGGILLWNKDINPGGPQY